MNSLVTDKSNEIYKFLMECNGKFSFESLNYDNLFDDDYEVSDYQKSFLMDDQERFVLMCKNFLNWFTVQNILDRSYYSEDEPYLNYIDIEYIKTKSFYDHLDSYSENIKIIDVLHFSSIIANTLERSILDIRLYKNSHMLDSPLLTDEYKKHFNMLLDIFEHSLLAKNMFLYDNIDGISKFPLE